VQGPNSKKIPLWVKKETNLSEGIRKGRERKNEKKEKERKGKGGQITGFWSSCVLAVK